MRLAWAFMSLVVLAAASAAADLSGEAASIDAKKAAVADYLTPKLPAGWSVHVSQDDQALVAYLMMPIQRAFELAYRPEETSDIVMGLCPSPDQAIWTLLGPSTRLDLEPVALGKGFVRLHCVRARARAPS